MKTVPITELRKRISDVIDDVYETDEPTVVLQRSKKAAYIVSPEQYERDQAELASLRREIFLVEVREAEAEVAAGQVKSFDDVEELIRYLDRGRKAHADPK
jgi:prevent-host-death family protein